MSAEQRRVLNSWKEIAQYLGRGVRTIQRYEQEYNLPVRRIAGRRRTAVIAFSDEVDAWLEQSVKHAELSLSRPPQASRALPSTASISPSENHARSVRKPNQLPNILIIEDQVERVDELRAILDSIGRSSARIFSTADDAIQHLRDVVRGKIDAPDLIVLDYELAQGSGFEVLKYYRASGELKGCVPLVVWTVLDSITTKEMSLWMGATAFVAKQSGRTSLEKVVRSAFEKHSAYAV
jgi:CheY-like chemotaxis protein